MHWHAGSETIAPFFIPTTYTRKLVNGENILAKWDAKIHGVSELQDDAGGSSLCIEMSPRANRQLAPVLILKAEGESGKPSFHEECKRDVVMEVSQPRGVSQFLSAVPRSDDGRVDMLKSRRVFCHKWIVCWAYIAGHIDRFAVRSMCRGRRA